MTFAFDSFCSNKVRFLLTALGMVIGTASLILVVTIGLTGKQYVFARGDEQGGGDGSPLQRVGVIQFDSSFANNGGGTEAIVSNNNIHPVADFFAGN